MLRPHSSGEIIMKKYSLHMGELVKKRASEIRMPVTEFAKKINKSRTVAYHIFKRRSIDSELLKNICGTLNYDFFSHYKKQFSIPKIIVAEPEETSYYETLKKNYEMKIEALNKEIEYLKEINKMLREKLKTIK